MHNPKNAILDRNAIIVELAKIRRTGLHGLSFAAELETRFEQETAKVRSRRLWLEGLIAILIFNGCLLVDALLVRDVALILIVKRTALITPLALLVNTLMLLNPPKWLREGSVALGIVLICSIHLYAQGGKSVATTLFGVICLLIMALFAGVVMRLRFAYAAATMLAMLAGGLWFLEHSSGLKPSEHTVTGSLLVIGVTLTLTAAYSLEKEERLSYLLFLRSDLQGAELAMMNAELLKLSSVDKLTGLPNRRALEERFETLWYEGEQSKKAMSAIVIDVDRFKMVNDVYGHLYGDAVLKRIAGLLPQALRGQADFAGRFGGEEFVILLPDADAKTAMSVAERVRSLVEMAGTPVPQQPTGETMLWTTVSCGVSTCVPELRFHRDNLIKAGDQALYQAKNSGRNRVEFMDCEWVMHVSESRIGRRSGMRLLEKLGVRRDSGQRPASKVS